MLDFQTAGYSHDTIIYEPTYAVSPNPSLSPTSSGMNRLSAFMMNGLRELITLKTATLHQYYGDKYDISLQSIRARNCLLYTDINISDNMIMQRIISALPKLFIILSDS